MLKKQNQPIPAKYKKCARVPVIMQMESTECGAAALAMVLAYYGKWVPLEQVRYDCGVSRDGSNMKNILEAAERYGLKAQGYGLDPEKLKSFGYFPCIVQMGFSHFVVVDGFTKRGVLINDPAGGRKVISEDEFDDRFTGATLLLRPSEDFKPEGRPASVALFIKKRMSRAMPVFVLTLIIMAVLGLVSYINPVFSTVFIDEIVGKQP